MMFCKNNLFFKEFQQATFFPSMHRFIFPKVGRGYVSHDTVLKFINMWPPVTFSTLRNKILSPPPCTSEYTTFERQIQLFL